MDLCQADLRCLDAHAHLGDMVFDGRPEDAIRHDEAGFRISELSLGEGFDGVLPWGWIDPRLNARTTRSSVTRVPPARYAPWESLANGIESTTAVTSRSSPSAYDRSKAVQ